MYQIVEQQLKNWAAPCHATLDGKRVRVLTHSGSVVVKTETELCTAVGLFFVDLMQSLCKAGLFKSLPRAPECYVGVATEDGEYGWPEWEEWKNWKV